MSYTDNNKSMLRAVYAGLFKHDEIRPLHIESDSHVTAWMSDTAKRKLAEVICKCDAFDAEAAVESFLAHELDHAHIGNRVALGITTGFFNDDWALGIPDRLTKFMIERAVQEIEDEVIL